VSIRNSGAACTLPASAFSVEGRSARAARAGDPTGFALAAGSTTTIAVLAPETCPSGAANFSLPLIPGRNAKSVVLSLGGRDAVGFDEPFPVLSCAPPFAEQAHRPAS
jgi:hypothetical protein